MSVFRGLTVALVTLPMLACSPSDNVSKQVRYHCGALPLTTALDGETLTLRFGAQGAQELTLTQSRSASGARFTDSASGTEFWSKGNEAQFSAEGFSLPLCVVDGTLPQQLNARGNEPFWLLEINGNQAILRQPGSESSHTFARTEPEQVQPLQTSLDFDNGWSLTLLEEICYDSMSGQSFPFTADLHTGQEVLQGCAGDPNRLIAGASWQVINVPSEVTESPSLTFHSDQRVSGFAGCNYLNGGYEITGEGLRFSPLAVTKRMCPPAAMDYEAQFLRELQQVSNVKVFKDGTLQLQLPNGDYVQLQQIPLKLWQD
ncbi:META domain-containing protein [Pseudidiomarina sp.]|uniref:META domain-containing protein n=1 Tax=Pseudidiomarina sp. TaxID=2081707 RepID=UPI003A973736